MMNMTSLACTLQTVELPIFKVTLAQEKLEVISKYVSEIIASKVK